MDNFSGIAVLEITLGVFFGMVLALIVASFLLNTLLLPNS